MEFANGFYLVLVFTLSYLSVSVYLYVCMYLVFLRVIYLSSQSQMCASSFIAYK